MKKLSSILLAGALLPVCLLAAGKSEASQADDYVPQVRNLRLLAGNYCIARDLVKNASSLPADTVYEFVPEPDFKKAGRYQTRVRLLYPDNSVETSRKVTVTVCQHAFELKRGKKSKAKKHRKSDAKRYEAKVKNRTTAFGKAFKSKRLVTNRSSLPKKTSFRFARVPNFKRAGSYYTSIQVTYPDKSRKYTRLVKITVKRQPDKKKYQPKVQGRTVSYGAKLTAKSLVKNAASLPKKTAYAFAQKVSSRRAGTYYVAVRVTYPDKSWELTPLVKLVVKKQPDKDRYQALVSSAKVTLGRKLTAKSLVKNAASLPKKTVYRFKPQPNWQKAGSYRCQIQVTYPDKSRENSSWLTVTVVQPADAARYKPLLLLAETPAGQPIAASSLIANFASLPAGSQASYVKAPDFAKAGKYQTRIRVTYPDKSAWTSQEIMIQVTAQAEK